MKKTTILSIISLIPLMGVSQGATLLTYSFSTDTGADFSTWVDGTGPFLINDISATADGVSFTFDLTLTGTGGTPAGDILFSQQRPRMDLDAGDTDIKGLSIVVSDIQGGVSFDGFITIDRFDNSGGDPWDVNGETISTVGNTVTLAAPVTGSLDITQLANTAGGNNGATRLEGFQVEFSAVPEPSSIALLGLGGLVLILRRRK